MLENQPGESRTSRPNEEPVVFTVVYWAMELAGTPDRGRTLRFVGTHQTLGTRPGAATRRTKMARVETIAGTGTAGYSESQVNNPYGLTIGPDGGLYFCEVGNQRIRRLDRATGTITLVAGNGEKGHTGDGGLASQAALNMP